MSHRENRRKITHVRRIFRTRKGAKAFVSAEQLPSGYLPTEENFAGRRCCHPWEIWHVMVETIILICFFRRRANTSDSFLVNRSNCLQVVYVHKSPVFRRLFVNGFGVGYVFGE